MPTVLTHPAVPLCVGIALGRAVVSRRLLVAGMVASVLPDLDVLAFGAGIPYAAALGHRGFSHSLLFAFLAALIGACLYRLLETAWWRAFAFLLLAALSHGLLDAFTNGGLGIALLAPWSQARWFAPVRPIEVAPLSLARFISLRGLAVLASELRWVWLPASAVAAAGHSLRRFLP